MKQALKAGNTWLTALALVAFILIQAVPASALIIDFYTVASAPLTIVSTNPAQEQAGVAMGTMTVSITFSRRIQSIDMNQVSAWKDADSGGAVYEFDSKTLGGPDNTVLTVGSPWPNNIRYAAGTRYYVEFGPSIYDTEGNPMDSNNSLNALYYHQSTNTYRLYFTTAASLGTITTAIGGITQASDTGGQTSVPITANLTISLAHPVLASTANTTTIILYNGSVGGPTVPITVTTNAGLSAGGTPTGSTITVTPISALNYSTHYFLALIGVQDTVGNTIP